jgi:hypothetical protein
VAGQVDEDHVALLGQLVEDGIPRLPPMGEPVDEDEWFAGSVSLVGEHGHGASCPDGGGSTALHPSSFCRTLPRFSAAIYIWDILVQILCATRFQARPSTSERLSGPRDHSILKKVGG